MKFQENLWLVYPLFPGSFVGQFLFCQCVVNIVATFLISDYCIFSFTPKDGGISHAISLWTSDVSEKNLVTFFLFVWPIRKEHLSKMKPTFTGFWLCCFLFGMFPPKYSASLVNTITSPAAQSFPVWWTSTHPSKPSSNITFPSLPWKNLLFSPLYYDRILIYIICLFL